MTLRRFAPLCVTLVLAILALAPGVAQAAFTHKYLGNIEGFSRVVGVAVGSAEPAVVHELGAVYVADHNASVVARFSASRTALAFTCEPAKCGRYVEGNKLKGTPTGPSGAVVGFGAVDGVAVNDATGEVYVSAGDAVDVFSATGEYIAVSRITEVPALSGAAVTGALAGTGGLAFDQSSDELYVTAGYADPHLQGANVVDVFKPEPGGGAEFRQQFGFEMLQNAESVTVSESGFPVSAGTIYVVSARFPERLVDVFDSMGTLEGTWTGAKTLPKSFGLSIPSVGIDPVTGHVFVADESDRIVDEMSGSMVEEKALGRMTGTPTGPEASEVRFAAPRAVTADGETGDLYVGDESVVDQFGPDLTIPDVEVGPAPSFQIEPASHTWSATVNGRVDPDAAGPATCEFEYGLTKAYGKSALCSGPVGEGDAFVAVHSAPESIEGLPPGTTYLYRLDATNDHDGETNTGQGAEDEGEFITPGPVIEQASVSDVASSSATLNVTVNPNDAATSVYFEYGRCSAPTTCSVSAYEARTTPEPIGSGDSLVSVEPHVQGLEPGSVYHYRVLASSEIEAGTNEEFAGEEGSFKTQSPGNFSLIDGRAWEMVSPPGKEGALIQAPGEPWGITQAADSGEAMTYMANVPTEKGVVGYANSQQVLATRGPDGWSNQDLASPHNGPVTVSDEAGQEYRFFSEDLSQGILQPFGPFQPCQNTNGAPQACFSPHASEQTPFLRDLNTSVYTPVATGCPGKGQPCPTPVEEYADVLEGTIFAQTGQFEGLSCPPEKFCGPFFDGASPDANHIIVHSDIPLLSHTPTECGLYEWNAGEPPHQRLQYISILPEGGEPESCKGSLGTFEPIFYDGKDARHAVSDNGSRVFWTTLYHLYMRDVPRGETIQIGGVGATFQTASSDGSRVVFTENSGLYECEISEALECDPVLLASMPGGNVGVDGASEDGSYVYYGAAGGLYVDHLEDGTWTPTFIAHEQGPRSRVSPDGHWLAFLSKEQLTGYDNRDANSGQPDEEAYLYDAETRSLTCASCDPTGARPVGTPETQAGLVVGGGKPPPSTRWLSAELPDEDFMEGGGVVRYQPRFLSDSGRLFFESYDALVPKDINGTWDVYEYEPEGVPAGEHACTPSSASGSVVYRPARVFEAQGQTGEEGAGCVGLISSGESQEESVFLDASETGSDVFFMTTSQLSTRDFDKSYDIYDAHECTGASPCVPEPAAALPECVTAEACRAAPMPEPSIYGTPPSATFNGLGNLSPAPQVAAKPVVKTKALTRAQKLAAALKACKKDRKKAKRAKCVRHARKEYGQSKKAKK